MEELKKWYRASLPASIEALKTARKTLDKGQGSFDSLRRIAHTIKNSAHSHGLSVLTDCAKAVEQSSPEEMPKHFDELLKELLKITSAHRPSELPVILIVEHDAQMANLLNTILYASDREIIVVGGSGKALDILQERSVSLIILDLSLPDTDGRNFLVVLRERSATAGVPVIVLSGMGGPGPKTECFALGADAYFEKPIAPEVLKAAVSARLHKSVEHRRASRQDALTGLSNRAAFCEGFQRAMALADRKKESLSLAMFDFDLLRRINDNMGHVAGDGALRHAAQVFSHAIRRSDFIARWGGDEFVLLLPNTTLVGARRTVEKMMTSLASSPFRTQDGRPLPLTFSAGLVAVPHDAKVEDVMTTADRLLYVAKTTGRGKLISEMDIVALPHHKVLLVESEEQVAKFITICLEQEGIEVQRCEDGLSCFNILLSSPISLLILDLKQNSINGQSLVSEFRRQWRGKPIPVLMLTALGKDADVTRGFEHGADDYLVRPFTPFDLMTRVHNLLKK